MTEKKKEKLIDLNPQTSKPVYLSRQALFGVLGIISLTLLAMFDKIDVSGLDVSLIVTALICGRAVTHLRPNGNGSSN
jgi:hypothetical protein